MTAGRTAPSLPWIQRLEARAAAALILLVSASLAAVVVVTTRTIADRALARAAVDLDSARTAFERLADDRAEFASVETMLVTALPIFRSHLTSREIATDTATMTEMLDEYRQDLKADFAILAGSHAAWIASSGWPASAPPSDALTALIADTSRGRSTRDIVAANGRLFLVVSEPARFSEEILGTLTIGYALDDAVAQRLAAVTHTEVNLVFGGHVYASSLPPGDRAALDAFAARSDSPLATGMLTVSQIGATPYAAAAFPLPPSQSRDATARLLLLQNWTPAQQFANEIRDRLLITGAVIFGIALVVSLVFSRRISRPLMDVAAAAEDIASGNWNRRVDVRGSAEAKVTAESFNQMTTSLRHWYEEAKKRDDELRQAQKLEALGRLAGGIAHDFNNLLTAIRGGSEILFLSMAADNPRREDVAEIIKAADRAAGLTRQLLAFSRRQVVTPRLVALDRVIAGTEHMLRRVIGDDIELVTTVDPGISVVRIDPTQIEQVLVNLAVNARDAMPEGGKIRISLANAWVDTMSANDRLALPPGSYVRLSVSDTGVGMSPETVQHIFEPFFTTKPEGSGTGLGLAMVLGIVEQAGGGIDVETALGRGTTFHVYLPQVEGEPEVPVPPGAASFTGGSETVLLVDDAVDVAHFVANALRNQGYTVLEASDAHHAVAIVSSHDGPIHLLITDVVMPRMNGRELAERLAVLRPEMRVLYMSGHSDDAILKRGIEAARVHFIQKPFAMDMLAQKIREVLGSAESDALS
jgi:signal transduction histidine kinase/CheY-like chemotaxis protein